MLGKSLLPTPFLKRAWSGYQCRQVSIYLQWSAGALGHGFLSLQSVEWAFVEQKCSL